MFHQPSQPCVIAAARLERLLALRADAIAAGSRLRGHDLAELGALEPGGGEVVARVRAGTPRERGA